jgi:hypothetical protein
VRIPEKPISQLSNLPGHGGREKQVLAVRRQFLENSTKIREEAHVEHVIRFVEDQGLHVAKAQSTLPDQVQNATGTAHNNFRVATQCSDLAMSRYAAENRDSLQLRMACKQADFGIDLSG